MLYAAFITITGFAYLHLKYGGYTKTEALVESNNEQSGDDVMRGIEKIAVITFEVNNTAYAVGAENTSLIPGERVSVMYESGNPKNAIYLNFFSAYLPTIIVCCVIAVMGLAAINAFVD